MNTSLTTLNLKLSNNQKYSLVGFRTAKEYDSEFDWDGYHVMLIAPKQHFMITLRYSCGLVKESEWGGAFSLKDELGNQDFVPEQGDDEKGIVNREYYDEMENQVPKGTPGAIPEVTYKLVSKDIERCLKDFLKFVGVSSLEELLQESDDEGEEEEAPEYIQAE